MGRSALILCDLQNAILSHVPDTKDELLRKTVPVLAAAREHAGEHGPLLIVHVAVKFRPGLHEISPNNKSFYALKDRGEFFTEGNPACDFAPEVAPKAGEVQVTKRRVGAFSTTDLQTVLSSNGVTKIYLAGIATSGVILSTVRDAADRDYQIVVIRDACTDRDEEVHRVLIEKVLSKQADIVTSEEFVAAAVAGKL